MDRFRAESNEELVTYLKLKGVVKSERTFQTMCKVDRKNYLKQNSYVDAPQSLGHGRMISAPHMYGTVLEKLERKLTPGKKALCIRCNSGYLTTCVALMLGPSGSVISVEGVPELYKQMKENIATDFSELLNSSRIQLILGYERSGYVLKAPYDIIYVGAAAEDVPEPILKQLANGGCLIMPLGSKDGDQTLTQVDKFMDGKILKTPLTKVRYQYLSITESIPNSISNVVVQKPLESCKTVCGSENSIPKQVVREEAKLLQQAGNKSNDQEWKSAVEKMYRAIQTIIEKKLDSFSIDQKLKNFEDVVSKVDQLEKGFRALEANLKEEIDRQSAITIRNVNNILTLKLENLCGEIVQKCTGPLELESKLSTLESNLERAINASVEKNETSSDRWQDLNDKVTLVADRMKDLEDNLNQKLVEEYVKSFKRTSKFMDESLDSQPKDLSLHYERLLEISERKREERDRLFLIIVVLHFLIIFIVLFFQQTCQ